MTRVAKAGLALGFMGLSSPRAMLGQAWAGVPAINASYDAALMLYFDGGPSQTDTWDVKLGSRNNVFNSPINLQINDAYNEAIRISEVFPTLANLVMNDSAVGLGLVRSMVHRNNQHQVAGRYMNSFWEGQPSTLYPSTAAVLSYYNQGKGVGIPSVVIAAPGQGIGGFGTLGLDYNSSKNNPLIPTALQTTVGNGQANNRTVQALQLPGVSAARYARRKTLRDKLNARFLASRPDAVAAAYDKASKEAYDVTVKGQAAAAFDLTGVPLVSTQIPTTHAQRLTQAVRLLEAGVPYVACGIDGNDTHANNMARVRRNWGDSVDKGVTEVVRRLKASGKKVLIIMGGEFGRTPMTVAPNANGQVRDGRDHWGDGFSWAFLSVNQAKFKTNAIGQTGPDGIWTEGAGTLKDPIHPRDLGAFVYRSLGFPVGLDVKYDIPLAAREAPPIDRINKGDLLLRTFGLMP